MVRPKCHRGSLRGQDREDTVIALVAILVYYQCRENRAVLRRYNRGAAKTRSFRIALESGYWCKSNN